MRQKLLIVFILFLCIVRYGWSQSPNETGYSDNPARPGGLTGRRIQAILDTLNAGDPERVPKFVGTQCTDRFRKMVPLEEHIKNFQDFFEETGGVTFSGIRCYQPPRQGQTVVILQDRNYEGWHGLVISFRAAPDFFIDGIEITSARPPKGLQESALTPEEFLAQVKGIMTRLIDQQHFIGDPAPGQE